MPKQKIKELLTQLHQELETTQETDEETRRMVEVLEQDIHRILDDDEDQGAVVETAQSLEAHFAAEHPVASRFLREIIDTLAKLGI